MRYIHRYLESKIKEYVKQFPVVALTGPRQAGKSTLLKHLFKGNDWEYVNLDQRGALERIKNDPDLFVKDIRSNVIIDEAQKAPDIFHSIKWKVDEGMKYKVVLSGSANFHLLHNVTETLAGRVGILELLPFSLVEKYRHPGILGLLLNSSSIEELEKKIDKSLYIKDSFLHQHFLWGGYPKLLEYRANKFKSNWLENYRTSYIERDLRDLAQVAEIGDFQRFYQMLAFQTGELLNLSNLANEIGVSVPTCKKYFQILESSYQYFLLRSFHLNVRKRLIKSPKVYIWDTGMCNYFLGNSSVKQLINSNKWGNMFENCVISEIMKQNTFLPKKANMYFWRTSNGAEVDLIIEWDKVLIPVEIKSSIKISPISIRGLVDFMKLHTNKQIPFGVVLYRGEKVFRLSEGIVAIPDSYL